MKSLRKVFLIVFAVVLAVFLLIGTALFLFVRNFDVNKYKPQIVSAMKQALNRDVTISKLNLNFSLNRGILLNASGIKIADDPQFSSQAFVSIEQLNLGVDILGVLIKRQVSISNVDIISPRFFLIRNEEGVINVQTLGPLQQGNKSVQGQEEKASSGDSKPSVALAAVLVQNIFIQNGTVSFKDNFEEEKSLEAKKIDFKISDFSLVRPFNFSMKAACFGEKQNVNLSGAASLDVLNSALVLKNLQAKIDLALMDVRLIEGAVPAAGSGRLKNPLAGQIEFSSNEVRVGAKGFSIGKLNGKVSGAAVNTAYLIQPIKNIEGKFEVVGPDLTISEASCMLGSGRMNGNASIKDYLGLQDYKINLKAADLNVKEVVNQAGQEVSLDGFVSFEAALEGQGLSDPSNFKPTDGTVDLRLSQGRLENINVLRIVLDKMSMLPDLTAKLEANLPEKYRAKLLENDTELQAVNLDMVASGGVFQINTAEIQTDIFSVSGTGTLDLQMNTEMQAKISIPKDLSDCMAKAAQELSLLADRDGCIVIPLVIEGKIPNKLLFMPDLEYLGRQLFAAEGRAQLNKVLDKVLKKGGSQSPGTESQSGSGSSQVDAAKEILGNVLGNIFNK